MKMAFALIALLLICAASPSTAQDVSQKISRSVVNDLNLLSQHANREPLLTSDVAIIAGATCNSARSALQGDPLGRFAFEAREKYPSDRELESIGFEKFRAFEEDEFRKQGASPTTVNLISRELKRDSKFAKTGPARNRSDLYILEATACGHKDRMQGRPEETATSTEAQIAGILVKGAVGLGVMIVDAAAAAAVVNPATIILTMASGGWGWNRVEEAVSELRGLDKKT